MKNRLENRKGVILIFVLVIFAMIEIYMMIFAGCAGTFIFQSDRDYLNACRQNLAASGLAWSKQNISSAKLPGSVIQLDISDMNITKGNLSVVILTGTNTQNQVQINASCTRGRQTIISEEKYKI